jgi:hypothetical protein
MTERARLTVQINGRDDDVTLYLNPAARERLIAELLKLNRADDHFYILGPETGDELQTSQIPYEPGDQLAWSVKVLLRYDDWDEEHFPHVMAPMPDQDSS